MDTTKKLQYLRDLIAKYAATMTKHQLWELLLAGHIIFTQGNGLSTITVLEELGFDGDEISKMINRI